LFLVLYVAVSRFLFIGRPNEVLVFSGRKHRDRLPDGRVVTVGYRKVFGGRAWRMPIVETVQRLDLTTLPVKVVVADAYTKPGVQISVQAIANVKISSDPKIVGNAIERFLGRSRAEIAQVAKDTLEGHLRQVLATMDPVEINEQRIKFAESLKREASDDLEKLGLQLDTLKIQHIMDKEGYLENFGRKAIAEVLRNAAIAESDAEREAAQAEAEAKRRAEVANQEAEKAIAQATNELRKLTADWGAQVHSQEERTAAAAQAARAQAEQELQKVRAELEKRRLEVDVVVPAEAQRQAQEIRAKGQAAYVEERGRAAAQVFDLMNQAWADAGHRAKEIFIIEHLEEILEKIVAAVRNVKVGEVTLLDSGDGASLASYVRAYPAIVGAVLDEVRKATGVDVQEVLAPRKRVG